MIQVRALVTIAIAALFAADGGAESPRGARRPNCLEAAEASAGWRLLFDGSSLRGWRLRSAPTSAIAGWTVSDGWLALAPGVGDLETVDTFQDFELAFEWRLASGANSGVKVRVPSATTAAIGPEYQLLDDPETQASAQHATGALYDLVAARAQRASVAGASHETRIVWQAGRFEHWLDGELLLAGDVSSSEFAQAKARSKFAAEAAFAASTPGHVVLQDHGGEVWFRSIRIRALDTPATRSLLAGPGLADWTSVGGAEWRREGCDLVGSVVGRLERNSFLCTRERFGDFVFEVEVLVEEPGNSGIQFRSRASPQGTVVGYQAEIDCSERSWSGGIYDEGRRAWLADLSAHRAGRAAFRPAEWNHLRIEARGPRLRTWVNGVLTAELEDSADAEGFFALQVHSGHSGRVRWRDPRVGS